jgi:hypothetical protein
MEKRTLIHCWEECTLVQLISIEVPQKTTYDPAIPILCTYLKNQSSLVQNTCTPMYIMVLYTTAKLQNPLT